MCNIKKACYPPQHFLLKTPLHNEQSIVIRCALLWSVCFQCDRPAKQPAHLGALSMSYKLLHQQEDKIAAYSFKSMKRHSAMF